MSLELVILLISNLLCSLVQLMPVISVPVTGISSNLYLSAYDDFIFGVFGICDRRIQWCSPIKLGYTHLNLTRETLYLPVNVSRDVGYSPKVEIVLPENTIRSVSQLLVMHVVAFASSQLSLLVLGLLLASKCSIFQANIKGKDPGPLSDPEFDPVLDDSDLVEHSNVFLEYDFDPSVSAKSPRSFSTTMMYVNTAFILSLLSFFSTLLAFLADIVLFTPHLGILIWIQAIPIVTFFIIVTFLCLMRQTVSWKQRILELDFRNDTYLCTRKPMHRFLIYDSVKDDAFYVYTHATTSKAEISENHGSSDLADLETASQYTVIHYDHDIPLESLNPRSTRNSGP